MSAYITGKSLNQVNTWKEAQALMRKIKSDREFVEVWSKNLGIDLNNESEFMYVFRLDENGLYANPILFAAKLEWDEATERQYNRWYKRLWRRWKL